MYSKRNRVHYVHPESRRNALYQGNLQLNTASPKGPHLTGDLLTFTEAPVQQPVDAEWYHRIVRKRAERTTLLACTTLALSAGELNGIASTEKIVRDIPTQRGLLSARELEITETLPRKLLRRLAGGDISAEDVLRAFIKRAVIAQELTNALSEFVFDYGIAQAQKLDKILQRTGRTVGPLHGLPLSIKDTFDVQGYDSTAGWAALIGKPSPSTSKLVQKLQASGAVIYCKTNVPQSLMSGECVNYVFGRTSTPFNTTLSAGGSSGGEGALISMGGSPLGVGTDIAGSVRTPANFCGIYGLTPSSGRLPYNTGSGMDAIKAVHGPLSRSVEGLEVYVQALLATKPWEWDEATVQMPWRPAEFEEGLALHRPLVLGVMRHDGVVLPHLPIQRALEDVVAKLRRAGHMVVEVEAFKTHEMMEVMFKLFGSTGDDGTRTLQTVLNEPLIGEIDPSTPEDALSAIQYCQLNLRKQQLRQEFHSHWMATRSRATGGIPIEALILPSGGHVAPPHGSTTYFAYEAISNFVDLPCATFPVDTVRTSESVGSHGFMPMSPTDGENWARYDPQVYANGPISLQVMGRRFGEEKLLGILRTMDEALGRPHDYQV